MFFNGLMLWELCVRYLWIGCDRCFSWGLNTSLKTSSAAQPVQTRNVVRSKARFCSTWVDVIIVCFFFTTSKFWFFSKCLKYGENKITYLRFSWVSWHNRNLKKERAVYLQIVSLPCRPHENERTLNLSLLIYKAAQSKKKGILSFRKCLIWKKTFKAPKSPNGRTRQSS